MTFVVGGKAALVERFNKLAPTAVTELGKVNLSTAAEMVELARGFAPQGRTGKLRASIVVTPPGGTPPDHSQGSSGDVVKPGGAAVSAGNAGVRYAHLVEFGTPPHVNAGKFAGTSNPGTRPRPFFWPAYRLIRSRMKARAGRALGKAIRAAKG